VSSAATVETQGFEHEQEFADYLLSLPPEQRDLATRRVDSMVDAKVPLDELDSPPRFTFARGLGDLLRNGIPAPAQMVEGLIYENKVHWLAGHPDRGKTIVALWVVKQRIEAGGHVVWIDWEAGESGTVEKAGAVGITADQLDAQFHYVGFPDLQADEDGFAKIKAALKDWPGALVVFDSASKALSQAGFSENDTAEATKWTTQLILPAREAGATVIVIDHVVKGATKATPYARGAGSKLADTDVMWYVERTKPFDRETIGRLELTRSKDRIGCLPEAVALRIGDGAGGLPLEVVEVDDEDNRSLRAAGMRGRVLSVLSEHSSPEEKLSGRQVVALTTGKAKEIQDALRELAADSSAPVASEPHGQSVRYWHDEKARTGLPVG
jgi:AAA domain